MRPASLLKVFLLLVSCLIFGGVYVLDTVDQSYEMNAAGSALEQALEPAGKTGFNRLIVSPADDVKTKASCRCGYPGTNIQQHSGLVRKLPATPRYQLLSSYRI